MTKRKANTAATGAGRRSKRTKTTSNPFVWNPREWKQVTIFIPEVTLLSKISDRSQKVVKKKDKNFNCKNHKPVPESVIWRFFLQMSQALAVMHNQIGPNREILLHRDIKPKNVLVVDNGTTYPSFKLSDFDCASVWSKSRASQRAICGTFEWQPPENPRISTKAADIWALGACVHYLATGMYPLEDKDAYQTARYAENNAHPDSARDYNPRARNYAARVPRRATPLNLSKEQQRHRNIAPFLWIAGGPECYNPQYSDELNSWMQQCLRHTPSRRPTAERLVDRMALDAKRMLRRMGGQAALTDLDVIFDPDS
ncbi:kinase-like protein [Setomelanomma holmii]|uniref:non-specific serine/threonine protein kinase n=1 Tax=Setomelanomma holmii TaxID=210430 RepID=A0A9P4HHP8_9PLEO|nr:kinase-like protein [Setomelanomma holmii]